jgi:hypothetical protein
MKKLFTILSYALLATGVFAQTPQKMSYQAVIRDASNKLITTHSVGIRINILQDSINGPSVYTETQVPTTNANGLVSIEIGGETGFDTINWSSSQYFIKTETDPTGGSSYTITSISQLLSVPYALYAAHSGISGKTDFVPKCTGTGNKLGISQILDNATNVGIGDTLPSHKLTVTHSGSTGIVSRSTSGFSLIDIDAFNGDAALRFANAGVNQWNIRNRPADNYLEIFELGGGGSRVVIQDATGNVGIGETTSPAYRLDVLHGGATGIRSRSSASFSVIDVDGFSGDAALRFAKAGVLQWNIRNNPATDDLQFFELGGGGERMKIANTTGYVTIATNLTVTGTLAKGAGAFKIDYPLDPAHKYLYHSFVESPDMMNIYNGNITTDNAGKAIVRLPDYFEALNMEFRYQLTVIGTFDQAIISKEISNNQFEIATTKPNVKVSWQVTGVRHDAYAVENRIPTVVDKEPENQGKYLHPEAYKLPATKGINYEKTKSEGSSIDDTKPAVKSGTVTLPSSTVSSSIDE